LAFQLAPRQPRCVRCRHWRQERRCGSKCRIMPERTWLRPKDAGGVTFAVYDPQQVSNYPSLPNPTGLLTPNSNKPETRSTWQGHLAQGNTSDFYYVLVTNMYTFPVTFSFCTIEKQMFTPPAQIGSPDVTTTTSSKTVSTITVSDTLTTNSCAPNTLDKAP
jgi:hypothetical protein